MSRLIEQPVDIGVVDYGMGNRRSVEKALEHVGVRAVVSGDPDLLRAAAGLVVPGVGAFPRAMDRLGELGLDELLRERVRAGTPVLGICLGMQLAFDSSTEMGGAAGLGIVAGEVPALAQDSLGTAEYGAPFVTAVQSGSFYGVQFHPEKSSAAGLRLLANFARICIEAAAPVAR
jgi:glutamine amidotransferase